MVTAFLYHTLPHPCAGRPVPSKYSYSQTCSRRAAHFEGLNGIKIGTCPRMVSKLGWNAHSARPLRYLGRDTLEIKYLMAAPADSLIISRGMGLGAWVNG